MRAVLQPRVPRALPTVDSHCDGAYARWPRSREFVASETSRESIESGGVPTIGLGRVDPIDLDDLVADFDRAQGTLEEHAALLVLARLSPLAMMPRLISAIDSYRPDIIVRDNTDFGAHVAGSLFELPVITVDTNLETSLYARASLYLPSVNRLRRSFGLRGLDSSAELST